MSNEQPLPTDLELTALDPVFREHPHDRLDRLRAEDPVHLDAELGRLFLTRFEDMRAVLADRSLSKDLRKAPDTPRRRAMRGDVPLEAFQPYTRLIGSGRYVSCLSASASSASHRSTP